mmetsp:Transcript_16144/g.41451  ORF Transcript_16144/g.41451 Transcript_16144/m.41451 type:complete len:319 (+) Transcript_16144:799-1755(+)
MESCCFELGCPTSMELNGRWACVVPVVLPLCLRIFLCLFTCSFSSKALVLWCKCEHAIAGFSDDKCMLKVGTPSPTLCQERPLVAVETHIGIAIHQTGFNSENHARSHSLWHCIFDVQHTRVSVKIGSDPVTTHILDHTEPILLSKRLNCVSDHRELLSRSTLTNSLITSETSYTNQLGCTLTDYTYRHRDSTVTMIAITKQGDINVDNVSILERPIVWDAMTGNLVHRRTARLGKAMIAQRRRICIVGYHCLVDSTIHFICGNTWFHHSYSLVQDGFRQLTSLAHTFKFTPSKPWNLTFVPKNGRRRSVLVVRSRDV